MYMKKLLIASLLFSAVIAQAACTPCTQALNFPDRFHYTASYNHGAPVESVSTLCDCPTGTPYVAIAGYSNFDCIYPKSMRIYYVNENLGNRLDEIMNVDIPNPSDYFYTSSVCCIGGVPTILVGGCPDTAGNVVWIYTGNNTTGFTQVASWGAGQVPAPTLVYSVAMNCAGCNGVYQIAVVGKAAANGVATVYLLQYTPGETPTLVFQNSVQLTGGDLFKAAWLPATTPTVGTCGCNIPCTILSVGGKFTTGDECVAGNIHNYAVTCNGVMTSLDSIGGAITLGGSDYTVRQIVWNTDCCSTYPYPFMLAIGDHAIPGGFESRVIVYWYNPTLGTWNQLAFYVLPGKVFAGQFTPGCNCKSVTVAGGCFDQSVPCTANIWNLTYDCAPTYPVPMTLKTSTSFDDTVTGLAFCQETNCWSMIVTSESANYSAATLDPLCPAVPEKGEIGTFKVNFCKAAGFQPCIPTPICQRKNIKDVPCRSR